MSSRRDAVWVADITHVPTDEGWLYVGRSFCRCTRRCIGWAMGETLAATLPLAALGMALQHRQPPAGLVHHSDRGNCYDNALMESFWSSLKRELVHRSQFATRKEARTAIFDWIEIFYNRERLYSALGFQSPVDFETNLN